MFIIIYQIIQSGVINEVSHIFSIRIIQNSLSLNIYFIYIYIYIHTHIYMDKRLREEKEQKGYYQNNQESSWTINSNGTITDIKTRIKQNQNNQTQPDCLDCLLKTEMSKIYVIVYCLLKTEMSKIYVIVYGKKLKNLNTKFEIICRPIHFKVFSLLLIGPTTI